MNKLVIKINKESHEQPGFHIFDGIQYDSGYIEKVDYTEYIWVQFSEIKNCCLGVPIECEFKNLKILYGYKTFSRRMKLDITF